MKPTLEQMKLAVATLLPDELYIRDSVVCWSMGRWAGGAVMDTEWLHVCWLAEKTLTLDNQIGYESEICRLVLAEERGKGRLFCQLFASAEHRLEALCRVKFPELFTQ